MEIIKYWQGKNSCLNSKEKNKTWIRINTDKKNGSLKMLRKTPKLYITRFSQWPVVEVSEAFYCREKFESET